MRRIASASGPEYWLCGIGRIEEARSDDVYAALKVTLSVDTMTHAHFRYAHG